MVTYGGRVCIFTILAVTRFIAAAAAAIDPMYTPAAWYKYCKAKPGNQYGDFDCSNMHLMEIPTFLPPFTVALDLSDNWIQNPYSRFFLHLPHLKTLILTKNKIKYISHKSFLHLENLEDMDLSHNDIKSIPVNTFMNLKQLKVLKISTSDNLGLETLSFAGLSNLMKLDLNNNVVLTQPGFSDIMSSSAYSEHVSVSDYAILRELSSLKNLRMQITLKCPVESRYSYPPNLTYLDLSNSDLSSLAYCDIFSNIVLLDTERDMKPLHLDISSCKIFHLHPDSFQGFQNVVSLNLSNNSIRMLAPSFSDHMDKLQYLDVSRNGLQYIISTAFTMFSNLLQLNLEWNIIQSIAPDTFSSLSDLVYLDLSNNKIESVSLSGLSKVIHLNLSRNAILNMGSNTLKGLSELENLQYLDLSGNDIVNILVDALQGLSNLQYLNLSDTKINNIAPNAFSDLHNFVNFDLSIEHFAMIFKFNQPDNESSFVSRDKKPPELDELFYPKRSLEVSLSRFDGDYVTWLSQFIGPRLVQTVSVQRRFLINGYDDEIHTYYFLKASPLSVIDLDKPWIEAKHHTRWPKSDQQVVIHSIMLKVPHNTMPQCDGNERYIRISSLHYRGFNETVHNVFTCFIDLKSLYLNNSVPQLSQVDSDAFSSLHSLETLDLSNNKLRFIDMTTLCVLDNLKRLNLAANFLTSLQGCNSHSCLPSLQILDLRDNPFHGAYYSGQAQECYHRGSSINSINVLQDQFFFLDGTVYEYHFDLHSLQVLQLTNNDGTIFFKKCNTTNLVILDLSNTSVEFMMGVHSFPSMTHMTAKIFALPFSILKSVPPVNHHLVQVKLIVPSLIHLDISHSRLSMNDHNIYFLDTENLNYVDLSFTAFDNILCKNHTGVFFENFTSLEYLNISHSGVMTLCDFYFQKLPTLTSLDASNNGISSISRDLFDHNKHLTLIDLSNNAIFTLEMNTFSKLTNLIKLYFENNPLDCTLSLEIQDYMKCSTNISFTRDGSLPWQTYQCAVPQILRGKPLLMVDLTDYTHVFYIFGAIVLFSFCAVSYFCWRKRWHIVFYAYKKISRFRQHYQLNRPVTQRQNFKYDAYVSYSSKDKDWVEVKVIKGLEEGEPSVKLCIHNRDFVPGRSIFDNITDEMKASRKFLFVVSKEFAKSKWCDFEMKRAFYMLLNLYNCIDDLILFLILEHVSQNEMSDLLKFFVNTNTYFDWTREARENGEELSFRKLKNALLKKEN